ncbi:hypothetical protein N0V85_002958 [Neurospora sp. IMI 360204]|nr:hypothetical protein N0V85_002958 [Neurospora sp. IMI 360204]
MATMLKPPPPKKPLPDLNLPWSETDGITFRVLLQGVDHTTNTTTNPEAPSSCPGPSSSSAAPARTSGTLSASYLSRLSQEGGGRITTSTKTQTPNRSTRPNKTKRLLKGKKRARSDSPPPVVVVKPEAEQPPQVLPSVEVSLPPSVRPFVLLTPAKTKTQSQSHDDDDDNDDDNDPGPVFPLSVEVVLTVPSRKVKAFRRGLREGIRRQVLKYYWEEGDGVTAGGDDDGEAYYTAVAEGWQVYLEKVQIKWEKAASAQEHSPAVTLPVNLLDRRRTDEELDGYLHMMHLRGYRDDVEVWFRWVKGEPQEANDDGDEGDRGKQQSRCIVIDDD